MKLTGISQGVQVHATWNVVIAQLQDRRWRSSVIRQLTSKCPWIAVLFFPTLDSQLNNHVNIYPQSNIPQWWFRRDGREFVDPWFRLPSLPRILEKHDRQRRSVMWCCCLPLKLHPGHWEHRTDNWLRDNDFLSGSWTSTRDRAVKQHYWIIFKTLIGFC